MAAANDFPFLDDNKRFLASLESADFLGDFSAYSNGAFPAMTFDDNLDPSTLSSLPDLPGSTNILSTNSLNGDSAASSASSSSSPATFPSNTNIKNGAVSTGSGVSAQLSKTSETDKRKVGMEFISDDDLSENESKRRDRGTADPEEKRGPGRKLVTTEPSNKRKAQNRAAQRAFRERKEKHLHDLEARVAELENDAHSMSTENQFLKKQVDRLQAELREYRKRQASVSAKSSPAASTSSSANYAAPFTFEFPLFGADPRLAKLDKGTPRSSVTSPESASASGAGNVMSSANYSPATNLSTNLSPAWSANSPNQSPSWNVAGVPHPAKHETDFCAQLSMACGNRENPIPRAHSQGILSPPSFDTDLFSEYRDPIFGNTEEEFQLPELVDEELFEEKDNRSSSSSSSSRSVKGTGVEKEIRIKIENDDEVVPAENKPLMGCTALWDRISMHPKFEDLDIDGLCSELRSKAKCSESGVVVTEDDLNDVLKKIEA